VFLEAADDYGLRFAAVPSLAFVESGGGKASLPPNNWFGLDSGNTAFSTARRRYPHDRLPAGIFKDVRRKNLAQILETYNPDPNTPAKCAT